MIWHAGRMESMLLDCEVLVHHTCSTQAVNVTTAWKHPGLRPCRPIRRQFTQPGRGEHQAQQSILYARQNKALQTAWTVDSVSIPSQCWCCFDSKNTNTTEPAGKPTWLCAAVVSPNIQLCFAATPHAGVRGATILFRCSGPRPSSTRVCTFTRGTPKARPVCCSHWHWPWHEQHTHK